MPAVSIITSAYNEERFIAAAVESILSQSFRDFEFIIVNDGSTDRTREILAVYEGDPRIRVIDQENTGYVAAWRRAIAASTGDLLARMDADDLSDASRLERQVALMRSWPDVGLVCTGYRTLDEDGRFIAESAPMVSDVALRAGLLFGPSMAHGTVMVRRSQLLSVGGYRPERWPTEDYDLWVRLALSGCRLAGISDSLYSYRIHSRSTSGTSSAKQRSMHALISAEAQSSELSEVFNSPLALYRDVRRQSGTESESSIRSLEREIKLIARTGLSSARSGPDRVNGIALVLLPFLAAPIASVKVAHQYLISVLCRWRR